MFAGPRTLGTAIARGSFKSSPGGALLSTLAILEQKDGVLNHGSLSAITAARKLGGTVHAFVAGSSIKNVANEAAKVDGVEKILTVGNEAYEKVSPPVLFTLFPPAVC
jgi:electron transfer flavoprotein alpha subunit